jgi:CRP-like cAMP-binding protein
MLFFRSRKKESPLQHLRSLVLFQGLSHKELVRLSAFLHHRTYLKGELIFDEGEEGQGLFIVVSGLVRITGKSNFFAHKNIEIKPGEFFGELALLDDAPRLAQAHAEEETKVVCLFRTDFFTLMDTDGKIAAKVSMQLARFLSRRLRDAVIAKNNLSHV